MATITTRTVEYPADGLTMIGHLALPAGIDRRPAVLLGPEGTLEGWTLHTASADTRHSALTHDAESGTSTPLLLARSRHASVRSLERYARPGVDSVARHVAARDPAARRRTP